MADPFWRVHQETPGAIILATFHDETGEHMEQAVFSSMKLAMDWAERMASDGRAYFAPMIVDEPEFGALCAGARN